MSDNLAVQIYDEQYITALLESESTAISSKGDLEGFVRSINTTTPGASFTGKVKKFFDVDLTQGNLLVYEHGLNRQIQSILLFDNVGEQFNVKNGILSTNTVFLDFNVPPGTLRPIPGEWTLVVN